MTSTLAPPPVPVRVGAWSAHFDGLLVQRPHMVSADAVLLSGESVRRMQAIVAAVEAVVALPAYRQIALERAVPVAHFDPGLRGAFLGYDFHLRDGRPWLIEINTNAGGGMINALLACRADGPGAATLEDDFLAMFAEEWRLQRGALPLRTLAIVDDRPEGQYLYPEFLLFRDLFRRHGIDARIVDAADLACRDGYLWAADSPIDLVYNRLTDFMLEESSHAALREAYLSGAAVVTPHPRAHALYANKRNLALLGDAQALRGLGVDEERIAVLAAGVPHTLEVTPERGEDLWRRRRELFFKPFAGYGSKAVYRGEKLTRGVWQSILAGHYVAQTFIPPSHRPAGDGQPMKEDFRLYVYAGATQLVAARLYRGQTTNFRTLLGGFAPVLHDA